MKQGTQSYGGQPLQVVNQKVYSAYEYVCEEDFDLLGIEIGEFEHEDELIEELIEQYGSDADVIKAILEKRYPTLQYFWLIDFIESGLSEYLHIRVWQMFEHKKFTTPTWLRDKHKPFYEKMTKVLHKHHIPETPIDIFLKYYIRNHKHDLEELMKEKEQTILDVFWDNVYWAFSYLM